MKACWLGVFTGLGILISFDPVLPGFAQSSIPRPDRNSLELPRTPAQVQLLQQLPLTLVEALALAEKNSRDLQIAALTVQRSQAVLKQARAALLPTVSSEASLGYERSPKDRLNDLKYEGQDAKATGAASGSLEASYDIFTSGRRSAQIQVAAAQLKVAELELQRQRSQIRLDVSNAYFDMQQADQQVRIAQVTVRNFRRLLQDAQNLEAGGRGTQFDIVRTRVQLGNAEQELIESQVQQDIARRQMVQLLSLGETVDVRAVETVQIVGEWKPSLEESILLAYQNRAELPQQLQERRIAQQQRQASIAEVLPQVSVFANYQFLNEFNQFNTLSGYAAGARVRWTLFNGGAANAAAAEQKANQGIAETRFAQTRNQIRFQVEQAYKSLQANAQSIQTATAAYKEAQQALEIAQFRFQRGVGTQLDVIGAENDLTRADVNRLRAALNYNRALAALQRAVQWLPSLSST